MVTHTVCSFAEIKCPPLKTPLNGNVSNINIAVENIVAFFCESGYEVTGQPLLLCQESGTWNGTEPVCEGVCLCFFSLKVGMSVSAMARSQPVINEVCRMMLIRISQRNSKLQEKTVLLAVLSKNKANTTRKIMQ